MSSACDGPYQGEIQAGRLIVYPKGVWDREGSLSVYLEGGEDTLLPSNAETRPLVMYYR
jgi:hypothetical protein